MYIRLANTNTIKNIDFGSSAFMARDEAPRMRVSVIFQSDDVATGEDANLNTSATGVVGLSSDAVSNPTIQEEYTRFTDASFVFSEPVASVEEQIADLEDVASIVSFLQRPSLLWYANLPLSRFVALKNFGSDTGMAIQNFIKSFDVPLDTMKFGKRIEKLTNFEWFKADLVFRVMTNVNPFVAGRLWGCFAPYDDRVYPECSILYKSRAAITSYPGVEIDLQSANAAEIRIPWSGLGDAFSLTSREEPIGKFYLFALSDVIAQGTPTIPIQVFSWFENISITGPTPRNVDLQSAEPRAVTFQANGEAAGPLTEITAGVAKAASVLEPLPVIGGVAKTVGWVSGIANKVCSIFGWSRPVDGSHAPAVSEIPARGYGQFKSKDSSTVLGFANDNQIVELGPNFLENVDEMSVEHICSRPAMVGSTRWLTNSVPLAEIGSYTCSPAVDENRSRIWTIGSEKYGVFDMSLFETLGSKFTLWRADIHFRICVVRTPFHVGRFEVFFVPKDQYIGDINQIDSTNLYRHVVDITETNEIEFVVPYMHSSTMLATGIVPLPSFTESIGTVIIRALSPLSCPETVGQFVTVNVWKWATNVALAGPFGTDLDAVPIVRDVALQGVVRNESDKVETVVFGRVNSEKNALDATQTVGGEMCVNLRAATRAHRLFPREVKDKVVLDANVVGGMGGYVGLSANIFAFYRGGLSYKLFPNLGSNNSSRVRSFLTRTRGKIPFIGSTVSHTTFTGVTPVHEIQVPFYSTTRRGLCNDATATADVDTATHTQPGVYIRVEPDQSMEAFVAGKDDLTFGYLIGPPVQRMVAFWAS